MRRRSRNARASLGIGVLVLVMCGWPVTFTSAAWGTYTNATTPVAFSVSTGTLAAPTGAVAVRGACSVLSSTAVNLSWTATSSAFADGYVILRSTTNGSGYAQIATVAGRLTTTYVDGTPAFLTTYYYVIQAKRNNWRSGNSNQASVTTPTPLCV